MSVSKGSACVCHVTEGSLCSLHECFIHREHSFLDASHAAFVGVSFIEHAFIDASHAAFVGVSFIERGNDDDDVYYLSLIHI